MNKEQAIGYMLLVCNELNLNKETARKLRTAMYHQFNTKTEEEAGEFASKYFNEQVDIEKTPVIGLFSPQPKSEEQQKLEEEFQSLWIHYPRKQGKTDALKAYVRARKRGVSFDKIAEGLEAYLGYIDRTRLDTSYVKHGSTWFRIEGWEDDYSQ